METEESIAKKNGKQASMEMVTGKIWKAAVMGRWEGVQSDLCKGNRRRGRYKGEIRVTLELDSTLCWLGDVDHALRGLDSVIIGSTRVGAQG